MALITGKIVTLEIIPQLSARHWNVAQVASIVNEYAGGCLIGMYTGIENGRNVVRVSMLNKDGSDAAERILRDLNLLLSEHSSRCEQSLKDGVPEPFYARD